jgi:hypothetical protein
MTYTTQPMKKRVLKFTDASGNAQKVEILGEGQQTACFGHVPADDRTPKPFDYKWFDNASQLTVPLWELPENTAAKVGALFALIRERLIPLRCRFEVEQLANNDNASSGQGGAPLYLADLEEVLRHIDPGVPRQGYNSWSSICASLKSATVWDADGEELSEDDRRAPCVAWSRCDYWHGGQPANWKSDEDAQRPRR